MNQCGGMLAVDRLLDDHPPSPSGHQVAATGDSQLLLVKELHQRFSDQRRVLVLQHIVFSRALLLEPLAESLFSQLIADGFSQGVEFAKLAFGEGFFVDRCGFALLLWCLCHCGVLS